MKTILILITFSLITYSKTYSQSVFIKENVGQYHRIDSCESLNKPIKSILLTEALNAGYKPCDKCKSNSINHNSNNNKKIENLSANIGNSKKRSSSNKISNSKYNQSNKRSYSTSSVQCSGRTKKGSRCERMTTNGNGRCWQH